VTSLEGKLALETIRPPDCKLARPAQYRIFNQPQILERRRAAGFIWVVRTRSVRFVDIETVNRLLREEPMGDSPMGDEAPGHFTESQLADRGRAEDRERKRRRQAAELMLTDPDVSDEDRSWAEEVLRRT
jgi:hypothetical protein